MNNLKKGYQNPVQTKWCRPLDLIDTSWICVDDGQCLHINLWIYLFRELIYVYCSLSFSSFLSYRLKHFKNSSSRMFSTWTVFWLFTSFFNFDNKKVYSPTVPLVQTDVAKERARQGVFVRSCYGWWMKSCGIWMFDTLKVKWYYHDQHQRLSKLLVQK